VQGTLQKLQITPRYQRQVALTSRRNDCSEVYSSRQRHVQPPPPGRCDCRALSMTAMSMTVDGMISVDVEADRRLRWPSMLHEYNDRPPLQSPNCAHHARDITVVDEQSSQRVCHLLLIADWCLMCIVCLFSVPYFHGSVSLCRLCWLLVGRPAQQSLLCLTWPRISHLLLCHWSQLARRRQ